MIHLEVCASSVASALEAQKGGAIRVELCDNLAEGGTTPSYAQIALAKKLLTLKVYPIIRPRGGDFLYSDLEFELMKEDIKICKALNCDGVVIGILTADGEIDKKRCSELIELAKPMPTAFHRAFDMTPNLEKSLETLIELGIERLLTSGGKAKAIDGVENLAKLVKQAGDRIEIMPGAGVNANNIVELKEKTGAKNFHSTCKAAVSSKMIYRNEVTKMGNNSDEFQYEQTSAEVVKKLISLVK
ncbi:MAG: copper homeostasis protein CutC [Sphingobacteriaceae bacterium]|nr:copper homeostasis protein CutC [Sphingobacteriaceae bacterium]